MTDTLTAHLVVPVANDEDARDTAEALDGFAFGRITAVHVVEKGARSPAKIPMEQAEQRAEAAFEAFRDVIPDAETEIAYNTHVVDGVFEVASAQGNVGLSSGITGPQSLPLVGKISFLLHMWIGRLEIIPILVAMRTLFNRGGCTRESGRPPDHLDGLRGRG